jgi:hypothetical protein
VFTDRYAVAERDFGHSHVSVHGGLQVHVITANARCDRHLKVGGLVDAFTSDLRRPEWLRNHYVRIHQLFLQHTIGPIFVGRYHQGVSSPFKEFAQT